MREVVADKDVVARRLLAKLYPDVKRILAGQVVGESVGIADVGSGEFRLVFDDGAAVLDQPAPGGFNTVHGHFEHRPQRRSLLNEQVDAPAVKADHLRFLARDLEAEMVDVEGRCLLGVRRLNQNVAAESVCH